MRHLGQQPWIHILRVTHRSKHSHNLIHSWAGSQTAAQSSDPKPHPARCGHTITSSQSQARSPTLTTAGSQTQNYIPKLPPAVAHIPPPPVSSSAHTHSPYPHSGMRSHTHTHTHTHSSSHAHTLACFCVLSELMRKVPVPCG